jgi:hypothetical protein
MRPRLGERFASSWFDPQSGALGELDRRRPEVLQHVDTVQSVWVPEEGFESALSPCIDHLSRTYDPQDAPKEGQQAPKAPAVAQPVAQTECSVHDVEGALSFALIEASKAGQWAIVAQLARELEARRLANVPNVVMLEGLRNRRPR